MGRRHHHCEEEVNYDERYVDHSADDCMNRAGGMDGYHDYEYYAQERAYSNQTGDIYDKSQEYASNNRQQEKSAAQKNYEQYLHLKKLGIADKIYGAHGHNKSVPLQEKVNEDTVEKGEGWVPKNPILNFLVKLILIVDFLFILVLIDLYF